MPPRRHVPTVFAVMLALGACASDDGRQLPPPRPDQTQSILTSSTTPPASTDPALAQEVGSDVPLTISPTAELALVLPWQDDAVIDPRYTCEGENVSPAVSWSNVPEGTVEIALVMTDPDAASFVHWVIAALDPATGGIPEGSVPAVAIQAVNGFGDVGYGGPCPPETHSYIVEIFAVGQQLELGSGGQAADLITAIESAAISTRSLAGRFPG